MKVIIIEDEPLMAEALAKKVTTIDPAIQVVAQLDSIQVSIDYLSTHESPDLFFSDIELLDGLSFEIFKRTNNKVPIIFCTAYNHYALEAFEVYGIDYLLKPYDNQKIAASLEKYQELVQTNVAPPIDYQVLQQLLEQQQKASNRTSILIHQGDKIIPLSSTDIALAFLLNGIVYVFTFAGKKYAVNYNLERLQQLLGTSFFRINRQGLINRKGVKHVSQYFGRKLIIQANFAFSEELIVSKGNTTKFLAWLEASSD
ncbi:MAG: LytTR family DNA-binding domain-containing protein [Bacteroidota bacterium]